MSNGKLVRSLSCDPGEVNYAYTVLAYDPTNISGSITLEITSFIDPSDTIRNITDSPKAERRNGAAQMVPPLESGIARFVSRVRGILDAWTPDRVVAERFMTRRVGTKSTETVGGMAGALMVMAHDRGMGIRMLPASQWKASVGKKVDMEALYAEFGFLKIAPHTVDATAIGLYDAFNRTGKRIDVSVLTRLLYDAYERDLIGANAHDKRLPSRS